MYTNMRNMNVGHLTDTALSLKERVMSYEIDLDPYLSCCQSDCYQIFSDWRWGNARLFATDRYSIVLKGPS